MATDEAVSEQPMNHMTDRNQCGDSASGGDHDSSDPPWTSGDSFVHRHIGPDADEIAAMLTAVGEKSLDGLIESTIPSQLIAQTPFDLPDATTEVETLERLREFAAGVTVANSFIGCGYYGTHVPPVIARNVLENPGWYTAYTPYQAEIAQGRLEMLLTFQQMVMDLTAMEFANASLLDEATAAAEAMTLCRRSNRKSKSDRFFVADDVHPQCIDVLKTRGRYQGIDVVVGPLESANDEPCFGVLVQYPGTTGRVRDIEPVIAAAHEAGALVAVGSDLLALTTLKPPGEMGADVVYGSAQRFGVPMGFGGPHAAFFATRDQFKRSAPGRIIGVSKDARGNTALRMAMQTREQHIRRDKATSNICTAQALLANMSAMYAIWHGAEGLTEIAAGIHELTSVLHQGLVQEGFSVVHSQYFDTLLVEFETGHQRDEIIHSGHQVAVNFRSVGDRQIAISLDETKTLDEVFLVLDVMCCGGDVERLTGEPVDREIDCSASVAIAGGLPEELLRTSSFLTHDVFREHRSETEMLRYLKRLENRDFSLTHGMIPLGSCTMKLNATTEMMPVSWPEFSKVHPFAPASQTPGYREMIQELGQWLVTITGYDAISMQPNSGAQGEYAGLLAIVRYHESLGQSHRKICLIPSSAHGTNPASASMMGLEVVVVKTDEDGNIDLDDLLEKATAHADSLSSLMITYPSTHGVFEETVRKACQIVHDHGGQVYMDGANMNALVGIVSPGDLGSDVSHLNLHKTFCIPHGGGGPGMGPIGVRSHLAPFLPGHVFGGSVNNDLQATEGGEANAVSAAPFGSASILPISWAYISLMGGKGLRRATEVAILNANYIAHRLEGAYDVLYTGQNDRVAHECIIDIRPIKQASGIGEVDIAKRLMDFGFHAPTMSWPVPGTMMIEPTESESQAELDRFCDAMLQIRDEIREVESGANEYEQSPLRHAPHTLEDLIDPDWDRAYSRRQAVAPAGDTRSKFWPTVNRVDDVYGDRNFVCACPPMSAWQSDESRGDGSNN